MLTSKNIQKNAEIAKQRSDIYGFLALVYLQKPTDELVKVLREPEILGALTSAGLTVSTFLQTMSEQELLHQLSVEYTRLFIGPGTHVSLQESVWCDKERLLWGETTKEVQRFTESLGLQFRADWTGIPDHISVELECMQQLAQGEEKAWNDNDKETALRCLTFEKKFMNEHLMRWVPRFCDRVIHEARIPFYQQMAQLTKEFITLDEKQIQEVMPDV